MGRPRFSGGSSGWCPICGAIYPRGTGSMGHRCDAKVLAAIDGAHRRDPDEEEPRERRSFGSRLEDGFMILDDIRDPEDDEWAAWKYINE